MRIASLLTGVVILAAGCSAEKPSAPFTARDSAGVRIVEHATLDGLATRRVAAGTPEVRIGTAMGDPAQVLDQVAAGTVLVDGSIILLNAGASEVRSYDSRGSLVWTQGQRGQGPGEYVRPTAVFVTVGDSLVVWDAGQRRLTMLTPAGAFGRDARLGGRLLNPQLVGTFADGTLVVVVLALDIKMGSSIQSQIGQDLRYSSVGEFEDSLGSYPGWTAQLIKDGRPVTSFGPEDQVELRQVPFSGETQRAVAADGYWVGTTAQRQVEFHDRGGALRLIARWPGDPLTVTDEDRQAYLDERIERAPTDAARTALRAAGMEGFEFAPTLPAHGPMVVDAAGNLWVSEFQRPGSHDLVQWTVFGPDGVAVSRVELPNNTLLLWAGTDRVLVRVTDELGIETVELWRLG